MVLERGPAPEEIGLAAYVRAVAAAVGVPPDGATWEFGTSPVAYVALAERSVNHPGRDVMLTWSLRSGWAVALEEAITGPALALAQLGGHVVPAPDAIALFTAQVLGGRITGGELPPGLAEEECLAELLMGYVVRSWAGWSVG